MPENKPTMTDNEIIKALNICRNKTILAPCPLECPMYQYDGDCFSLMQNDIFDLINRQQADNERLKKLLEEADVNYNKCAKRFYKEGIKEFAELLYCHCENRINNPINQKIQPLTWAAAYEEFEGVINDFLEEMVGDAE